MTIKIMAVVMLCLMVAIIMLQGFGLNYEYKQGNKKAITQHWIIILLAATIIIGQIPKILTH